MQINSLKNDFFTFLRFIKFGVINTITGFAIIYSLIIFEIDIFFANIIAYSIGFMLSFFF
jgi:putative flippase GtrA